MGSFIFYAELEMAKVATNKASESLDYILPFMTTLRMKDEKKINSAVADYCRAAAGLLQSTATMVVLAEVGVMPVKSQQPWKLTLLLLRLLRTKHPLKGRIRGCRKQTVAANIISFLLASI